MCRPVQAKEFFSKPKNKLFFYLGISLLALLVPTAFFVDYLAAQGFQVGSILLKIQTFRQLFKLNTKFYETKCTILHHNESA